MHRLYLKDNTATDIVLRDERHALNDRAIEENLIVH